MDKLIKLIKERLDLATKRNFKTIHITITPAEAEELIKIIEESKKWVFLKQKSHYQENKNINYR